MDDEEDQLQHQQQQQQQELQDSPTNLAQKAEDQNLDDNYLRDSKDVVNDYGDEQDQDNNLQDMPPKSPDEGRPGNQDDLRQQDKLDLNNGVDNPEQSQINHDQSQLSLIRDATNTREGGGFEPLPTQGDNVLLQENISPGHRSLENFEDGQNDNGGTNLNTESNQYAKNRSLEELDQPQKLMLTDQDIVAKEERDNANLSEKIGELEALQRQKPPERQEELVSYLMKRLKAAEGSIKVCEEVIQNERDLRKQSSKQMKEQIKDLQDLVQMEKRSLADKVSSELDATLKQAVREKVEIKKELEQVNTEKDKLQDDYDDMVEMYNALKQTQKQSEDLNDQSQKIIADLEEENKLMKREKEQLSKANIDTTQKMETAFKDHDDIKGAFMKLDEARYMMNKIMGPNGSLEDNERKMYLNGNMAEHDQLVVRDSKNINNQLTASQNINPVHSLQGNNILNNNPSSKAYFGQAGIAGNQNNLQNSLNLGGPNIASPSPGNRSGKAAGLNNYLGGPTNQQPYPALDTQNEDDDFWYQTPVENGNPGGNDFTSAFGGGAGQQTRLY